MAWDWNGPRLLVALELSRALGRPVTVGHLDITDLAGDPLLVATDVSAAQAGTAARISARLERAALLHGRVHVLSLTVERLALTLARDGAGAWNWSLPDLLAGPVIDHVVIEGGSLHVTDATRHTDLTVALADAKPAADGTAPLIADAAGTYAAQPIKAHLAGGSLDALRDGGKPYAIALELQTGATSATVKGTILNPLQPKAAQLAIELRGNDLVALRELIPLLPPFSRPYHLAATAAYADGVLRLAPLAGTIGASDVEGTIAVALQGERPSVTAELASRSAAISDLADVTGLAFQPSNVARVISDAPLDLGGLSRIDATVSYRAARITTESVPLENGVVRFTLAKGRLDVSALSAEAQGGSVAATLTLDDTAHAPHAVASLDFRAINLKHFVPSDSVLQDTGRFTGSARLDATGGSLAKMLGQGQGEIKFIMSQGDMSAFLTHLPGVELADPVISALHLRTPTPIRCAAGDFSLDKGAFTSRVLEIDTSQGTFLGRGGIKLSDETIDYHITPAPNGLAIASLLSPVEIKGTLRHPIVAPATDVPAPSGLATALGTVLAPVEALIGTVQNSLGSDEACADTLRGALAR